ncbi:S8 family serine peptidase [Paraburkholderia azotifigens]|uniref:S8 family serine peptidase n=1 Tax=Paraburkholderia azotifigens TaxID=2057004 RepID=A0A5C6V8E3_9BURK|nr:S8 family serine peptidase [Paraburkholderia azotifigens]TXC79995.1 S8 family serine peptidase [Paraburkholderia azotifigens]
MNWQSLTGTGGAWSGIDWTARAADTASADPYLAWADATQFADLGGLPAGWIRVIIELEAYSPNGSAQTAKSFADDLEGANAAWQAWIRVSSLYRYPPADLEQTRFLTAVVTKAFFGQLDTTLKGFVRRFEFGMPVVPDDLPATPAAPAAPNAGTLADGTGPAFGPVSSVTGSNTGAGQMVFLGVMDDGLAFAHERFRSTSTPSTTRIERFWNQDDAAGTPPSLHYGSELRKADIDALLARCTLAGQVEEDAVYAQAGYINVRKRWAHGTEVMDLAGGLRPNPLHAASMSPGELAQRDALAKVRVLGVQFRTAGRTVRDTTGRWFAVHALDAMRYILRCADDLASGAKYCVVLNLSYGYMAGPHDGSSIIESAIEELIALHHDLSIVVPAGNSNVLRCHASFSVANGASKDITWRALPDCATPGFMEIWLPEHADASKVTVRIHPPWGDPSPVIAVKNMAVYQNGNGRDVSCTVVYLDRVATGGRNMILIALAPTVTRQPSRIAAPAGNWVVTLANLAGANGSIDIHAWIQRNETAYGFPIRGRQSRFEDPRYKRFVGGMHVRDFDDNNTDSWISRRSTLNSIATGDSTVVVGAYRRTDGTAAAYSSTGPSLRKNVRDGPDATAISEDSPACAGVLGASTRSGSLVAMSGTSAAAPQVARVLACTQVIGQAPVIQPHGMPPFSARAWVKQRAGMVDPAPGPAVAHQLGKCPGTATPPIVPLPTHTWVPLLPDVRGGKGRFPSPRWKKRGVKL